MIVTTIIISSRENPAASNRRRADGVQRRKFRERKPVMWKDFIARYQSEYFVPSAAIAWD